MTTNVTAEINERHNQVRTLKRMLLGTTVLCLITLSGCSHSSSTVNAARQPDVSETADTVTLDVRGRTIGTGHEILTLEPSEQWQEYTIELVHKSVDLENKAQEDGKGYLMAICTSPLYGSVAAKELTNLSPTQLIGTIPPSETELAVLVAKSEDVFTIQSVELRPIQPVVEFIRYQSELMSEFYGEPWFHEVYLTAPKHVSKKTPVLYSIDGFVEDREWSSSRNKSSVWEAQSRIDAGSDIVYVYPNVGCEYGHHVMLDSEVNGPVGTAFVTELLPYIDDYLGAESSEGRRYVTGHSSGGWTVVHLMLSYPDAFALGLATSPDPLDLHYFHEIDIYSDTNAFVDEEGIDRVFGRNYPKIDSQPTTWKMTAADPSLYFFPKQLISYEAAFGTPDEQGHPRNLFHRETGEIDPAVAASWKDHDLKLLADELEVDGKAEVFDRLWILCGTEDNFGLHEGVAGFGMRGDGVTFGGRAFIEWVQDGNHNVGSKANESFREYIVEDARD